MIKAIFLKGIKFYQKVLSPDQGIFKGILFIFTGQKGACRFYPSCSQYCYLAIKKYGALKGSWRGLKRILRCHPWSQGGIDLP